MLLARHKKFSHVALAHGLPCSPHIYIPDNRHCVEAMFLVSNPPTCKQRRYNNCRRVVDYDYVRYLVVPFEESLYPSFIRIKAHQSVGGALITSPNEPLPTVRMISYRLTFSKQYGSENCISLRWKILGSKLEASACTCYTSD